MRFAEAMGWNEGLERKASDARGFYGVIAVSVLAGLVIQYSPISPMKALFWSAVINGVVAVPLMVVIILLVSKKVGDGRVHREPLAHRPGLDRHGGDGAWRRCHAAAELKPAWRGGDRLTVATARGARKIAGRQSLRTKGRTFLAYPCFHGPQQAASRPPYGWEHGSDAAPAGRHVVVELALNTGRYAVFAVLTWAVLWVVLKAPLAGRKIRAQTPPNAQMALEFVFSLRSIALFATSAVLMDLLSHAGAYPLLPLAREMGPVWFWASLVLMIIGHDAYYYWTHRAMHRPAFFRRVCTGATTAATIPRRSPPTASTSARPA